ncbi:LTA synthase family protein [Ginsengibacter hankyongi]|uniref:LTA synthase family protein n=1 Tax=Ginsengibacter hankyongi TaxID=2607284 RepID=A0A5J5INP4_9BACT|nr:alkaline phosphatase family protein [Ginsengibacter hankyongi]KAA9041122.1 LTA synthase family protein [Ginsengibacter hankyongi]
MNKYIAIVFLFVFNVTQKTSAQLKTENLVIVTLDGMRWQEVYGGADSALLKNNDFTKDSAETSSKFWSNSIEERRKKLFPFLWSTIVSKGQLYGNRWDGNKVNNANRYKFSYPGYNEIFTGYPDTTVNSNDKIPNKNSNVLGFLNQQNGFKNKVAAFTTWDAFPYIFNKWESGIYVNSDTDSLPYITEKFRLIDDIESLTTRPIGVRPDVLTYIAAREYMKERKPKVLYIAFDETDDLAHAGMYNLYLGSAHAEDGMIADLWNYIQSTPQYKNKTTSIITCDHGRGDNPKENWTDHGEKIKDAGHIWIAALGPDTKPGGEMKNKNILYQEQLAATFAKLLGFTFTANHPIAQPITTIYK